MPFCLPPHRRGLVALGATGAIWGTIGIVVRLMQDRGEPALAVAFWRLVCACIAVLPLLGRAKLGQLRAELRRPGRLAVVAVGSLAFQLLFFLAVRDVGVAVSTLIALGLAPVVLTAADAVAGRRLPRARTMTVLALALLGLALVSLARAPDISVAPRPVLGIAEAVASGLAYAASTAWSAPLTVRLHPVAITAWTSAVGVVLFLPVVAATGWHAPTNPALAGGTVWLGVVTTVLAYGLFYAGLRSTPGSVAMILTLLEPVVAVLLAAVLLDESLTAANVVGGALLLAAIVALYVTARPAPIS